MKAKLAKSAFAFASAALFSVHLAWTQTSASVSNPEYVKAGESVRITGNVDRAPNFAGSSIQWTIAGPDGFSVQSSAELEPGQTGFSFSYTVPAAAKAGRWSVSSLVFWDGVSSRISLQFAPRPFTVIANEGLVYPRSAEISLLPSQVQLLRGEALRIQAQIQDLKGRIKETPASSELSRLLRLNITDAMTALSNTQAAYQKLDDGRSKNAEISVFFSDIRTSYAEALASVNRPAPVPSVRPASYWIAPPSVASVPDIYPALAQGPLRALEHNERAYETVANADSLTFDLQVASSPAGAKISYRRRGDRFEPGPDPTNATIKSLPYAIWIVHVELPGIHADDKEHNALNEDYHVLHFDLVPNQTKR